LASYQESPGEFAGGAEFYNSCCCGSAVVDPGMGRWLKRDQWCSSGGKNIMKI
jgi:hypothetical protein